MTAARYRQKGAEVEAVQFTGSNADEVAAFANDRAGTGASYDAASKVLSVQMHGWVLNVRLDDYVIKAADGTVTHCPPERFADLFEAVSPA